MENIIINFETDNRGIDASTKALTALTAKEKELTSTFDKGVTQSNSSLKTFTDNIKNAEKATVGAFATKGLKEYQAAISQTLKDTVAGFKLSDEQARKFFKNLQDEARKGLLGKGTKEEMKQFQASLNAATAALKELGAESDKTGGKTQSLKSRLREMKAELATLDTGSSRFISLAQDAAELEDRIGDVNEQVRLLSSDTSNLDAGIQAIQGIAGAFAAAQGALALFGAEEGEVQETLLKVNAAMSIMQGIQQVGALLDKNSALNIFLIKTLRIQQAASTTAVAVAETEAAVAQQGLNAAMAANPAGILILALGTLVGLIEIFIGDTKEAAKAQDTLNQKIDFASSLTNGYIEGIKKTGELRKAELIKQNASAATLREQDAENLRQQLVENEKLVNNIAPNKDNALEQLRAMSEGKVKFDKDLKAGLDATVAAYDDAYRKSTDFQLQLEQKQIENSTESFKERLKNRYSFC
jgi:hypothetical protein